MFVLSVSVLISQSNTHTHTVWTHHEGVGGTHTMEAVVERGKLLVDGLVQQEVHIELDVLWGRATALASHRTKTALPGSSSKLKRRYNQSIKPA